MKGNRIIILVLLVFSFINIRAESIAIDCNDTNIIYGNSVTCDVNILENGIKSIDFSYDSALDVTFKEVSNTSLITNENRVNIKINNEYTDKMKVFLMIVSSKDNEDLSKHLLIKDICLYDNSDNCIRKDNIDITFKTTKKELDRECYLTSISIDGVELSNFSKDVYHYEDIYIDKRVIFIDAVRKSDKASVTGLGNVRVKPDETITRVIHVVAENGDTKDYTLVITNGKKPDERNVLADSKNTDNTIKSLELSSNGKKIDFNFESSNTNYNVVVSDDKVNEITITALLSDEMASFVSEYGPRKVKIDYGFNVIELKVKAQNDEIRTYTINISKDDNRNRDSSLKSLTINDQIIDLEKDVLDYNININTDDLKTVIYALPNSDKAKVIYKDIDLYEGENLLNINVTAENGNISVYNIKIVKEIIKNTQSINIKDYEFNFNLDVFDYDLKISNEVNKLDIIVNQDDYEIIGNDNLENGSKIIIRDLNNEKDYTINIIKDIKVSSINEEEPKSNLYYVILGIGIVILVLLIIYIVKRKRSRLLDVEII